MFLFINPIIEFRVTKFRSIEVNNFRGMGIKSLMEIPISAFLKFTFYNISYGVLIMEVDLPEI